MVAACISRGVSTMAGRVVAAQQPRASTAASAPLAPAASMLRSAAAASTSAAAAAGSASQLRRLSARRGVSSRAASLVAAAAPSSLPEGYASYETMIVLRPDMTEEERDVELAKFEAFLKKEGSRDISALVRGSQRLAYPIRGYWDGVYVLYRYGAKRSTSQAVQKLLSLPPIGAEQNVLRHLTFAA